MATKPSAHFKRVLSVLRQVAAKIPDSQEAAKVSTDLDSLLKRRKQTVDKHEISVLVRQAEAKLVMARIRYKSIVQEIERQGGTEAKDDVDSSKVSDAERFKQAAEQEEEELRQWLDESERNQAQVTKSLRRIAQEFGDSIGQFTEEVKSNKKELDEAWDQLKEFQKLQEAALEASREGPEIILRKTTEVEGQNSIFKKAEQKVAQDPIEGIINVDPFTGNFTVEKGSGDDGLEEGETYVIRKGRLVKGKARKREEAAFTNWHGGNADPEDLLRHRELLDRQHFKGPVWEGTKPKSVLDTDLSRVAKGEGELHPSEREGNGAVGSGAAEDGEGLRKQKFEKVVR